MKKKYQWFTLMELLLVLFIISVGIIWVSSLNLRAINDREKLDIFANKLIIAFEEMRTNALLWKWIGNDLEVPNKWKIEISTSGNGSIETYSNNGVWNLYDTTNIETDFRIKEVSCLSIDESFTGSAVWTVVIEAEGSTLSLTWACDDSRYKKTRAILDFKNNFEKTIEINTINGLIESI